MELDETEKEYLLCMCVSRAGHLLGEVRDFSGSHTGLLMENVKEYGALSAIRVKLRATKDKERV